MIFDKLKVCLDRIKGQRVVYSRSGGGAGSILLINFINEDALWFWRYWEVIHNDVVIGCSNDDITPVIGKVAVAALQLEERKVLDVILYEDLSLRIFFDNHYELIIVTTIETRPEFIDLVNWEYCSPELDVCYTITSQNEVITSKYEE